MTCKDVDALQANYNKAVREFTKNANKLRVHAPSISPAETDCAIAQVEAARRALRDHIIEHRCC